MSDYYEMQIGDITDQLNEAEDDLIVAESVKKSLVESLSVEAMAKQHYIEMLEVAESQLKSQEEVIFSKDCEITQLRQTVVMLTKNIQAYKVGE